MTLEEERRASTNTSSNDIDIGSNIQSDLSDTEIHNISDGENQPQSNQNSDQEHLEQIPLNQQQQEEDININPLIHYINQIRLDNSVQPTIPPELLSEDQDLLESEFENLYNEMDVIEMYINRLDENANKLQEKLRDLLQLIQDDDLPN